MRNVYVVHLSEEEKAQLQSLTKKGKTSARKLNRARVYCFWPMKHSPIKQIAKTVGVGTSTVERIRKRFVTEGSLEAALTERPPPAGARKLSGKQEAYTFWLGFKRSAREGNKRWTTMQLLADKLIELEVVNSLSDQTVRRTLKRGL